MRLGDLVLEIDALQHRVVQDAIASAMAQTWQRRAVAFDNARPRAGDYSGGATKTDLEARDRDLAATARACRARALVDRLHLLTDHQLDELRNRP